MTRVRDIMTVGAALVRTTSSIEHAATILALSDFGAVPVCDERGRLVGMLTDRDIVVKVVALGGDPARVAVGDIADQREVLTVGADDPVEAAIETMKLYKVRRLPVLDRNELVGLVSQSDIAHSQSDELVGQLVAIISS